MSQIALFLDQGPTKPSKNLYWLLSIRQSSYPCNQCTTWELQRLGTRLHLRLALCIHNSLPMSGFAGHVRNAALSLPSTQPQHIMRAYFKPLGTLPQLAESLFTCADSSRLNLVESMRYATEMGSHLMVERHTHKITHTHTYTPTRTHTHTRRVQLKTSPTTILHFIVSPW